MLDRLCPCLPCLTDLLTRYFADKSEGSRPTRADYIPVDLHRNFMSEEVPLKHDPQMSHVSPTEKLSQMKSSLGSISEQSDLLALRNEIDVTLLGDIKLNIPEYGTNYHLLKQKVHNAADLLNVSNSTQLKISRKEPHSKETQASLGNKSKIQLWKKPDNAYVFEYEMPCTYQTYSKFSDRQILPEHKNKYIRQYRILDHLQSNLSLRYLCFEKIGMLESRCFSYLKYTHCSSTDPDAYWEVCVSKQSEQEVVKPISSATTRTGKLFSVSYIKEEQSTEEGTALIKIRTYINMDINVGVEKVWQKILIEANVYIEELWQHLNTLVNELQ